MFWSMRFLKIRVTLIGNSVRYGTIYSAAYSDIVMPNLSLIYDTNIIFLCCIMWYINVVYKVQNHHNYWWKALSTKWNLMFNCFIVSTANEYFVGLLQNILCIWYIYPLPVCQWSRSIILASPNPSMGKWYSQKTMKWWHQTLFQRWMVNVIFSKVSLWLFKLLYKKNKRQYKLLIF